LPLFIGTNPPVLNLLLFGSTKSALELPNEKLSQLLVKNKQKKKQKKKKKTKRKFAGVLAQNFILRI
jgi:hypothetical protein